MSSPRPTALVQPTFAVALLHHAGEPLRDLTGTLEAVRKQLDLAGDRRADDAQKAIAQLFIIGQRITALKHSLERKPSR